MPQIIPQISEQLHISWQKELSNVVTDPKKLLDMLEIDSQDYLQHFSARKLFPVRVPRPFITRMKKGDFNDPLLKQVMPLSDEFVISDGYSMDPLEEHDTVAEGLLHKYKHRVLMIIKSGCAVNCRYCFRRHFPYDENSPNKVRWQPALKYIADHPEINEVIFSGGDPLMASDDHLQWLIEQLEPIKHLTRLRIHTRLPIVIPQRITTSLVNILSESRLKATMVLHINHPNEIDDEVKQALEKLRVARIPLFNQSVLLKGVNDDAKLLCQLSETLFDSGIQPYYLHMFDPVQGVAHFDICEEEAKIIVQKMMAILPGFLMPKLVREIAGEANKTPINLA
ncbi:MAG: EF-P beta-lysylation protein EpmB [Colwellia sp.]|jgi:EF-P beta-lysylation protein EpmB|uniref:EF-P beta-lysylation protein EpmB n=1 Tax=unclassified Colwellia TaxID=196834 RepID=UPI0015F35B12|nr:MULTISPECIES: EF-P beta-lysylation protein EpmB [unclassified Colwellia]MBA6254129.1 EF-P beta-lysylation protein EpmB [Colwellia sp. MB3u-55]MBA6396156.1 EF-P beta-lysylation protein EpmB [Colwellia sp. BRX10-4]